MRHFETETRGVNKQGTCVESCRKTHEEVPTSVLPVSTCALFVISPVIVAHLSCWEPVMSC